MTSYSFYETSILPLEKVIPKLLHKIFITTGKPILLLTRNAAETSAYDKLLWSFSSTTFLPHGTLKDSKDHYANILVSENIVNDNQAEILLAFQPVEDSFAGQFKKVIYVYQQSSKDQGFFRNLHKMEKDKPGTKFWQQDKAGKWEMF